MQASTITARPLYGDEGEPYLELRTEDPHGVAVIRGWLARLGNGWTIDDPDGQLEGSPKLPWTVNLKLEV